MPLRDDLLNPIPGDNPSGENLRYAPVYDKIKEARRQDDDAPQGEWQHERKLADWPQVIKLASEALAVKSKDLQLAVWLTEAILRREGFAGFKAGIDLLLGLVENFWDTLYPEIEDGDVELRATPLDWVGTKFDDLVREAPITRSGLSLLKYKESRAVGYEAVAEADSGKMEARQTAIAEGKITAEDFDKAVESSPLDYYEKLLSNLDGCLEGIDRLSETCEPRFGEYAPGFGRLREAIEEVRQVANGFYRKKGGGQAPTEDEAPVEEEAGTPAEESWAENVPAAAPARAKAGRKVTSVEPADREDAADRVAATANYLRADDPYSPAPYLLLRGLRWGELRASGEEPDPSLLDAPPTETRKALRQFAVDGQWAELLEAAESAMAAPCGRAWLDLQRYVVRACTESGYDHIAAAIRSELRALLADIPRLAELTLLDDTPTANTETQSWIRDEIQTAAAPAASSFAVPSAVMEEVAKAAGESGPEAPPDAFQLAMNAVREGRFNDGVELLMQELVREPSGRGRFQRYLQVAQICISNSHEEVALPILRKLAAIVDTHHLEDWEPAELVAHPFMLLYHCLKKLDRDPEEQQRVYERLCRLNPIQALACAR